MSKKLSAKYQSAMVRLHTGNVQGGAGHGDGGVGDGDLAAVALCWFC